MQITSSSALLNQVGLLQKQAHQKIRDYRKAVDAEQTTSEDPLENASLKITREAEQYGSAATEQKKVLDQQIVRYLKSEFPSIEDGFVTPEAQLLREELKAMSQEAEKILAGYQIKKSTEGDSIAEALMFTGAGVASTCMAAFSMSVSGSHPEVAFFGLVGTPLWALGGAIVGGTLGAVIGATVDALTKDKDNGWNMNDNGLLFDMLTDITQSTREVLEQTSQVYEVLNNKGLALS